MNHSAILERLTLWSTDNPGYIIAAIYLKGEGQALLLYQFQDFQLQKISEGGVNTYISPVSVFTEQEILNTSSSQAGSTVDWKNLEDYHQSACLQAIPHTNFVVQIHHFPHQQSDSSDHVTLKEWLERLNESFH